MWHGCGDKINAPKMSFFCSAKGIISGNRVFLSKMGNDGRGRKGKDNKKEKKEVATRENTYVGENFDGTHRTADVIAKGTVECLRMNRWTFLDSEYTSSAVEDVAHDLKERVVEKLKEKGTVE